jgi:histidinol-phosphate aminotransferase
LFLTYVDPGDEVVYPWRSFEVYPVYTQLMAGVAVTTPLTADHAFDLDAVAAPSPTAPNWCSGDTEQPDRDALSTADMAHLLDGISPATIVVIDEAYREFSIPRSATRCATSSPLPQRRRHPYILEGAGHGRHPCRLRHRRSRGDLGHRQDAVPVRRQRSRPSWGDCAIDAEAEIGKRVADILSERARVIAELTPPAGSCPRAGQLRLPADR